VDHLDTAEEKVVGASDQADLPSEGVASGGGAHERCPSGRRRGRVDAAAAAL